MSTRLVVVSAGLSIPSTTRLLADRLADAAVGALEAAASAVTPGEVGREPVELTVVELRDLAHPIADALLTGFASGPLAEAVRAVGEADALIVVTPVFSASYSGLFKSFVDILEPGLLEGKPVLLGATAGTPRHSLVLDHALRPLFSYLRAAPVATGVFAASQDLADGSLSERIARAAGELADAVHRRPRTRAADPFASVTPFAELLG